VVDTTENILNGCNKLDVPCMNCLFKGFCRGDLWCFFGDGD